ncbi:MAG: AAA family ATPase, partial [Candidatus Hydrogenedentes bacterium]|nr:AAA family ATPase [Candidatus Hydrogenedentota bacterium]
MYITRVKLENIRGFRELDLSFASPGDSNEIEARKWTVLLGDNATGKTTLLKCIAFGLCDESSAAGLVTDKTEAFIRQGEDTGTVYVELEDRNPEIEQPTYWTIRTCLTKQSSTGEQVEQKVFDRRIEDLKNDTKPISSQNFPWKSLFVAGYGAGRIPEGSAKSPDKYRRIDAVYTIFDYEYSLQDPELTWRRLQDAARHDPLSNTPEKAAKAADEAGDQIQKMLRHVLLLNDEGEISLKPSGIIVKGPGYEVPLSSHSDGYKATAVWLLDLLSWRMLNDGGWDPKSMKGIVLVDEVEQHLHPRWQRYIISRLQSQFPKV